MFRLQKHVFLLKQARPCCLTVVGHRGYSPEHLCELSFEQRYDDGEADAGGHQVQQGGLDTDARD